jgi:hypothetical protein
LDEGVAKVSADMNRARGARRRRLEQKLDVRLERAVEAFEARPKRSRVS